MKHIVIQREKSTLFQTEGIGYLLDEFNTVLQKFYTLEPSKKGQSGKFQRINAGKYWATAEIHPLLGKILRLRGIEKRSGILVHSGNYARETRGCILIGTKFVEDVGSGRNMLIASKYETNLLINNVGIGCQLEIEIKDVI